MAEERFKVVLSSEDVGTHEVIAPIGWDDVQQVLARDAKYHGVTAKYTLDFSFIKNGREFLQTVYQTRGIEAVVLLVFYEWQPNEKVFEPVYTGRINLSKYRVSETDATTNAEETGFIRALLNLEDVEVDLYAMESLNGAAMRPVPTTVLQLHSKAIAKRYEARVSTGQAAYNYRPVVELEERGGTLYVGFDDEKTNELNAYSYPTGISLTDEQMELIPFRESATITVEYVVDMTVECFVERGDFDEAEIRWYIGVNGEREEIYTWLSRVAYNGDNVNGSLYKRVQFSGSRTYNVAPDDKLFFYGYTAVSDISGNYEFEWQVKAFDTCSIRVTGTTTTAATPAFGYMAHEACARTVEALTGLPDSFYSEELGRTDSWPNAYAQDGPLSLLWLSNGSQIRQFPMAERPVFLALQKLFDGLNAIKPMGMAPEQTVDGGERIRMEAMEFFYREQVVLELGMVSNLALTVAPEYYFNTAEFGYEKWGSNADNSLDEFNTKQTRLTPITQLKGKYTRLSPFCASGYLLEEVRRLPYAEFPTKEDGNDKTNFFVCVLRRSAGGFETERNQRLILADNVLSPETMYNAPITPMRNAMRHGKFLRTPMRHLENQPLKFQQGEANYQLRTQFIGEPAPVAENGVVLGSDLARPPWIAEYMDFTVPLPLHQRKLIEQNPYGIITFRDSNGAVKKGWLIKATIKISEGTADFRLLRYND